MANINTKKLRISTAEKLGLVSNLATMLSAGISILEVVDSLLEDAKGNQKKLLESLKADLAQGNHVSDAFSKFPKIFDKITVSLLKASEEAGTLDITLTDLKASIRKDAEYMDRIKGALTYPVLIFFVFSGVLLMILIVFIALISKLLCVCVCFLCVLCACCVCVLCVVCCVCMQLMPLILC